MRFLNKRDFATLDRSLIQEAVRHAYRLMQKNAFHMPDRIHVQDRANTLLLMPCFSGPYFGTKLVSVFPDAAAKGLPVVNGVMTLADNRTGAPLAIMDGAALTAERTGAVGGLGVDLLTLPDIQRAGIFGAGVQGLSQARYLMGNRKITQLMIMDLFPAAAQKMADILSAEFPGVHCRVTEDPEALVAEAQVVIAATTSPTPLFKDDPELVAGKTFVSIGSFRPDMKEFPDAVITGADSVYVDTPFAAKESGDLSQPLDRGLVRPETIQPFSDLLSAPAALVDDTGRPATLFFKSVGMALFDLCVASAAYEAALEKNLGVELEL